MEDLLEQLFPWLKQEGVKDYDDLSPSEQETYRKILEVQQRSQITLEDYKRHIHAMRQSVEYEVANALIVDEKSRIHDIALRARLKCYLLLEALFERPERAKQMLEQYSHRLKL